MSALWIANVHVTDEDAYAGYASLASQAVEAYGGVFLARAGRHRQLEGRERTRNVVVRFPSMEQAVACYESPEYAEALKIAKGASERDIVVVEELPN